jgi:PAS domain S-box-containing protein
LRTRTFQDTIRPEDIDMSRENARRLIAGEIRSTQAEMRYVQPGGDIFTVLVNSSLVRGGHGPPRYFIAHFQDITEGKRVKEALRESEEKFRQMADTIDDSFWVSSPDLNTIQYVSAGYSRIWGRSIESLYANHRQWVESILPEDRDPVFAEFAGLAGNAPEASIEYRIARPDGTVRWIHTRGFQVRDGAGNLIRIAGIASDITERKLAQLEIERLNADLEQRVARRTQALYAATQEAEHANAAKNSANSALGSSRERSSGIFFMISTL